MKPSAPVMYLRVIGLSPTATLPSNPSLTGTSSAVPFSLGSQTPHVVSSYLSLLAPLETTSQTDVSLSRYLATVKRERHAACWGLAAARAEHFKMKDKNNKLRSLFDAIRDAFQMLCPSLTGLMSQFDSVLSQMPPTDVLDDEASGFL